MGQLVNNILRSKNLSLLLSDMGIASAGVNYNGELVVLRPINRAEAGHFVEKIQELLQTETTTPAIVKFRLDELLIAEINQATICTDMSMIEKNKKSLEALLPILGLDFTLDEQQEYLDIQLPKDYVSLFGSITYRYMTIKEQTLRLNLKEFLKDHKNQLILIDGESPIVLTDATLFERKKVFYAEKTLGTGEIEITPHVFIPRSVKPPIYTFILDTSSSMTKRYEGGTRLESLKNSAIKFAEAIWDVYPGALIKIKQFNSSISELGSYNKSNLEAFSSNLNNLTTASGTALYSTVLSELSSLSKSHNNILLFTDGENTGKGEEELKNKLQLLSQGSILERTCNKFFFVTFNSPAGLLSEVAKLFSSPIISTTEPDFIAALAEKNRMQEFVTARDLLSCRLEVNANSKISTVPVEQAGQFVAMQSSHCKKGDSFRLTIHNGSGEVIFDDLRPANNTEMEVASTIEKPVGFFSSWVNFFGTWVGGTTKLPDNGINPAPPSSSSSH